MLTLFDDFGRWTGSTFWINPETGEWRLVSPEENGQHPSVSGLGKAAGIESSLDVKATARILGCSTGQIHKLCNAGELSFHWVGTKRRFTWRHSDLGRLYSLVIMSLFQTERRPEKEVKRNRGLITGPEDRNTTTR
jgi:hypothetical protein